MENIIETISITKKYGALTAVNGVSISVRKGEIYGFLGLNGAGKTTTIKLLLNMVRPDSGEARILGRKIGYGGGNPWDRVGYLVETPYSYPELTVAENIGIFRRLRGIGGQDASQSIMEKLRLTPYENIRAGNLSLGNYQRLGLAKALLHNPEVLILDEPSNGLDPAGIVEIREMLTGLASDKGITILVSSHNLGEIAKLATRIGIIHKGSLIQEIDAPRLESLLRRSLLVDARDRNKTFSYLVDKGLSANKGRNGVIEISDENAITNPDEINSMLVRAGHTPTLLKVEKEDLETYFLRIIGEVKP
jgi:ABC-2 type transport system ATP-binding protein